MMVRSSWTTFIQAIVNELQIQEPSIKSTEVYIFGSAKFSESPNDIDLLIVYNKDVSVASALEIRRKIAAEVVKQTNLFADICLLSEIETATPIFIKQEKALKVFP